MALMTVYHGGYHAVEKPEIRVSRNTKKILVQVLLYCYKGAGTEMGETI